jgi:hypothetical protein
MYSKNPFRNAVQIIIFFSLITAREYNYVFDMKQIITLIANYDILLDHLHKSFVLNKGTRCDKPLVLQKKKKRERESYSLILK